MEEKDENLKSPKNLSAELNNYFLYNIINICIYYMEKEDLVKDDSYIAFNPECVRKRANWSKSDKHYKFDTLNFNPAEFLADIQNNSPKLNSLLEKIAELDQKDMKQDGHFYKHFIFCDIKSSTYGAKMLAAGLIAKGMTLGYHAPKIGKKSSAKASAKSSNSPKERTRTPIPAKVTDFGKKKFISEMDAVSEDEDDSEDENSESASGSNSSTSNSSSVSSESTMSSDSDNSFEGGAKKAAKVFGKIAFLNSGDIKKTKDNNFFLLSSVAVYDQPISVANKKHILQEFNKRPDNIHGENIRFIIMDSGFKEGIDLFDIKYVHIFEPSVNSADQKQVIGRGTRTCGQKGLQFHPTDGWPLHVFIYDLEIPEEMRSLFLNTESAHELYLKSLNIDLRLFEFGADLEKTVIFGSVDYELNRNIHEFSAKGQTGGQQYPPGTQEKYNSFQERIPVIEDGMKKGIDERRGGVWKSEGFPMKGLESFRNPEDFEEAGFGRPGVPPKLKIDRSLPPLIINTVKNSLTFTGESGDLQLELPTGREIHNKTPGFKEMREYVRQHFADTTWPPAKMENLCEENKKSGGAVITFSPTQEFVRRFFTPQAPVKGMLLWHSVGTGKTCSAIAAATSSFEPQGYTILWVTRTTLKSDIWKNMFDQICSETIRRQIQNSGLEIPADSSKRMQLLSKSWKIRPLSYKQFSNLVSQENNFYKTLVQINGKADPLRKTLLIIDEAHKLYGGGDGVLSSSERPDMNALHKAIMHSYSVSGNDSVRLLLMTATPITNNPMELVKLMNLCKPGDNQMPDQFPTFSDTYLNEDGRFSDAGKTRFLDEIAGLVSYLNRERDARQFSQPVIQYIKTPIISDVKKAIEMDARFARGYYDKETIDLKARILETGEQLKGDLKGLTAARFASLKDKCANLEGAAAKQCIKVVNANIRDLVKEAKDHTRKIRDSIKDLRAEIKEKNTTRKDAIKAMKDQMTTAPAEFDRFKRSLYYQLKYKCAKKITPATKLKDVSKTDPIIAQLDLDINANEQRISQIEMEIKSELDGHKARIKRIKTMLRTGDLNELERNVLKLTMADVTKTFKTTKKESRKILTEDIKNLIKTRKNIEKAKRTRYAHIKKTLKAEIKKDKKEEKEKEKEAEKLKKAMIKQGELREELNDDILKNLVAKYSSKIDAELESDNLPKPPAKGKKLKDAPKVVLEQSSLDKEKGSPPKGETKLVRKRCPKGTRKNKEGDCVKVEAAAAESAVATAKSSATTPITKYANTYLNKRPTLLDNVTSKMKNNLIFQVSFSGLDQFKNYKNLSKNPTFDCFYQSLFSLGLRDINVAKKDSSEVNTKGKAGVYTFEAEKYIRSSFGLPANSVQYRESPQFNNNSEVDQLIDTFLIDHLHNNYATIVMIKLNNTTTKQIWGHYLIAFKHQNKIGFFDPQKKGFMLDLFENISSLIVPREIKTKLIAHVGFFYITNVTEPKVALDVECPINYVG